MSPRPLLRFRRVTTSGMFIPEIDGLRFVAIALVFLYHLRGYLLVKGGPFVGDAAGSFMARVVEHGRYGVELFFVISGFILALPFAAHRLNGTRAVSLKAYFLRRLTRLEPPYFLSMLLFFALLITLLHQSASVLAPHLAASLLYVHNAIYGAGSLVNNVAWSLEVEIQFYMIVPLLARLFAIASAARRRAVILGLMGLALAFQAVVVSEATPRLALSVLNYLQFFLAGFLLADIYLVEWRASPRATLAWDAVSLVGWPLLPVLWTSDRLSHWMFPAMAFVLYCAAFRGRLSRGVFSHPLVTAIGGMCYTTYLLHYQILAFVGRQTTIWRISDRFGVEYLWQLTLIAPVVLVVCGLYFLLIEKPCMRPDWPQRLAGWVRQRRAQKLAKSGALGS